MMDMSNVWIPSLRIDAVETEDIFVDIMSVSPDDEKCIKFADYLVENYVTNDSKFPPSLWAEIPSDEKKDEQCR